MNILVYFEERNGQVRKPSLEAVEAARSIGAHTITAVVVTNNATGLLSDAVKASGVSKIYVVENANFANYSSKAAAKAIAEVAKQTGANIIVIPATGRGKDLAPRVAVRLEAGYVPDVTSFSTVVIRSPQRTLSMPARRTFK